MKESISSDFPFESRFVEVLGSKIHYVEEGTGDPILFMHGNPTSSYLWRNVIPHLSPHGRAIAFDLIGMGKSEKPDLDYRFADHARYVAGFIDALGLTNITFVLHDWGSGLGFDWAMRHPEQVKGIAFMEAIFQPFSWSQASPMERFMFRRFRHPRKGRRMNIDRNFFVERLLPMAIVRKLSNTEMDRYREPYREKADRKPVWAWPREIPFDGEPADVYAIVSNYHEKLRTSPIPKLLLYAEPGMIVKGKRIADMIVGTFANTQAVFVGKGRHFIQEDQPRAIGEAIAGWYRRISG